MARRLLLVASIIVVGTSVLPVSAQAATTFDADEVGGRLDIRSVTIIDLAGDRVLASIVFWDRTPIHLLRKRSVRVEMSSNGPHHPTGGALYGLRFWPNQRGRLRVTWGEIGSGCCGHDGAQHPNAFTYTSLTHFVPNGAPIRSFRATTTRRIRCSFEPRCGLYGGRPIDHAPWARD